MSDTALSPPAVGCTLREFVETTPQGVTDAWCRQLVAQLLRSIETQQAMGRPHRIIMPDSIVVHADGAAELLSSPEEDSEFQPPTAVDLKAIAAVLHFAITGESPPGGPLTPRAPAGLSASLLDAIDACLYGDRSRRPQTIEAMRDLLGMAQPVAAEVAPAPAPVPVAATPLLAPVEIAPPPPPLSSAPPARASRWVLGSVAIALLAAAGYGLYQHGRQAGAESVLASTAAPAPAVADAAPLPASPAASIEPEPAVEAAQPPAPAPESAAPATSAETVPAPAAGPATATYKLIIKPWGTVYVDGVKRGISPPLKSLTLTGEHTIRIDNPDFHSRTITVRPGKDNTTRIEHAFH
ncbi:MAG: hypothetical protein ACJ8HI_18095 [Massilia sp.]